MKYKIAKESLVKIITPEVFVRCGYPSTIQIERSRIINKFSTKISKLFTEITGKTYHHSIKSLKYSNPYDKMITAIAYASLAAQNFGGTQRSIHTSNMPIIQYITCRVLDVRYVVTGTYQYGSLSPYDEDYEPPALINQKRHKILHVVPINNSHIFQHFEIEECNVVNLMPDIN